MGNFWNDLNKFLAGQTSPDPNDPSAMFKAMADGISDAQPTPLIEGIQPQSTRELPPVRPEDSAFWQSTDDLNRLIQQNPSPFQTVDIDPGTYVQAQLGTTNIYSLQLDLGVIEALFGKDGPIESEININGVNVSATEWRTVPITLAGTFLKFEYLQNSRNISAAMDANSKVSTSNFINYQRNAAYENNIANVITGVPQNDDGYARYAEKQILIQFNSIKSPVHILRPGDVFDLPFSQIFIHFKYFAPRFRLTIGNKARIERDESYRVMNSNPAFGPGIGIWESTQQHPTPFHLSEISNTNASNGQQIVGAGASVELTLIDNTLGLKNTLNQDISVQGVAIGWLCSVLYTFQNNSGTTSGMRAILAKTSGTKIIKVFSEWESLNDQAGIVSNSQQIIFNIPIRFSLYQGEKLKIFFINGTGVQSLVSFTVDGYMMGSLNASGGNKNVAVASSTLSIGIGPFAPTVAYDHDPFPGDNWTLFGT